MGSFRKKIHSSRSVSALCFLAVFIGFFALFATKMGLGNMFNTMMGTAYRLLIDTCFYLMAVAVLAGAIAALFSEFGVVELIDRLLSPLMGPLFDMPGAASLGVVTTYLSDNPAIISLARDRRYLKCFKEYQVPALTNLGTSFGMGLIVTIFVLSQSVVVGSGTGLSAAAGTLGAVCGAVVSTRLMIFFTKKEVPPEQEAVLDLPQEQEAEKKSETTLFLRFLNCLTEGGRSGVDLGLDIIPGVLVICTVVMMLTYGPGEGGYSGAPYEGIALLPYLAGKLDLPLKAVFGFSSGECVAVPIVAVGSSGAALSMVSNLLREGYADLQDLAVFNAICMCWSGYLSTHLAMMSALKRTRWTGKAILSHTLGGLCAGFAARWIYVLLTLIF